MENFIYFYEWSDIDSTPKKFSYPSFFKAMKEYGIRFNLREASFIQSHNETFAICKKGRAELVLSGDKRNLRKNYHKHLRRNAAC